MLGELRCLFTFFLLDQKESNKEKIKTVEKFIEKLHFARCEYQSRSSRFHNFLSHSHFDEGRAPGTRGRRRTEPVEVSLTFVFLEFF
jgi:hypothetical protein